LLAVVMPKLHYIYLAQGLSKTRFSTWFSTGFEHVSDKSATKNMSETVHRLIDLS